MTMKTHWIALRVLGLLLLCLGVIYWKLPSSLFWQHAFPVVVLSTPSINPSQGPVGLPTEFTAKMGPGELMDITIDVALAWPEIPINARDRWIHWLSSSPAQTWAGTETLELFLSVAGTNLSQRDIQQVGKVIQYRREHPSEEANYYAIDRITGYEEWRRNQLFQKYLIWVAGLVLVSCIVARHVLLSSARSAMIRRLARHPNLPFNSDPTVRDCGHA